MSETTPTEPRQLAAEARDRVRFEEEALELADQVYRVARRLVGSREEAEDLMQETYARAFRSWQSYTPGTNLRAWLLRILTNLNIDRGRRKQRAPDMQPLEEGDYFLYNKLEESSREPVSDQDAVVERLSQDDVVSALSCRAHTTSATCSCSSTSATSPTRTRRRSSTSRSAPSCRVCIVVGVS